MENNHNITIEPVTPENWREIYKLEVKENQKDFVTDPGYYLCLCSYGNLWHPLAVVLNGTPIGFLMWAIDDEDNSCWLGGIIIDKEYQGKGFGKRAISLVMELLAEEKNPSGFALSYLPDNQAKKLYEKLGFIETGEMEDDEIVARRPLSVFP